MLPFTRSGSTNSGPTLVLMHFYGSSRREWTESQAILSRYHPCVALDMPGFGEANNQQSGFDMAAMAQHVIETVNALSLPSVVLVGHSFSGKVAQIIADQAPDWLKSLILVASSPLAPQPDTRESRDFQAHYDGNRAGAEQFVSSACVHPLPKAIFARAVDDAMRGNRAAWKAWPTSGADEDWSGRVGKLSLPTLIVVGEKDPTLPLALQERMVAPFFTTPRIDVIQDAGHLLPMETPERLSDVMHDFIVRTS